MTRLPAMIATIRASHVRCTARADDCNWWPEHPFPSLPDHLIACEKGWPCDAERIARAAEDLAECQRRSKTDPFPTAEV